MATKQLTSLESYTASFDSLEKDYSAAQASWVQELRKSAFAKFNELGFPTARRGNEEWKYTDIRPLARRAFQPAAQAIAVDSAQLLPYNLGNDQWHLAVFLDGKFNAQLSSIDSLPDGVTIESMASVLSGSGSVAEQHVSRHMDYDDNAFAALNTAFLQDGAFVHLDNGAVLEEPIHLLFVTTSHDEEIDVYPRVLILTGRDASASIVESHVGLSNGIYLSNAVTEIVLGTGASLRYYKMQRPIRQGIPRNQYGSGAGQGQLLLIDQHRPGRRPGEEQPQRPHDGRRRFHLAQRALHGHRNAARGQPGDH